MNEHDKVTALITLFNSTFEAYNTRLQRGDDEPIYLPTDDATPYNRIVFAHGYFSSALHEVAHWCIAGEVRRTRIDYGYWYEPDGRNAEQQAEFEQVEVKPQAIEWAFSLASNHAFRVSTDNLNGAPVNTQAFTLAVKLQLDIYMKTQFPPRAAKFLEALERRFSTSNSFSKRSSSVKLAASI